MPLNKYRFSIGHCGCTFSPVNLSPHLPTGSAAASTRPPASVAAPNRQPSSAAAPARLLLRHLLTAHLLLRRAAALDRQP
eukprot:355645-Chlamydomonas_euryale.AAC.7